MIKTLNTNSRGSLNQIQESWRKLYQDTSLSRCVKFRAIRWLSRLSVCLSSGQESGSLYQALQREPRLCPSLPFLLLLSNKQILKKKKSVCKTGKKILIVAREKKLHYVKRIKEWHILGQKLSKLEDNKAKPLKH